jgi:hypothetical protein
MTTTNLALIGGVVVLLLVMLKLRRDKASSGGSKAAKPAKAPKAARSRRVPKAPKLRVPKRGGASTASAAAESSTGGRRKGKRTAPVTSGPAGDWPEVAEVAATAEPTTEPDWDAMRADATGPRETPASTEIIPTDAPPAWEPGDVVTAPGWPLPGEVDVSWDAAAAKTGDSSETWLPSAGAPADVADEVSDWLGTDDDPAFETAITPGSEPGWQEPEADESWDALVTPDLAAEALAATQITGDTPSWLSDDDAPTTTPEADAPTPNWADFSDELAPVADARDSAEALAVAAFTPEIAATAAPETWLGADLADTALEIDPTDDADIADIFATPDGTEFTAPPADATDWQAEAEVAPWIAVEDAPAAPQPTLAEEPTPVEEPSAWIPVDVAVEEVPTSDSTPEPAAPDFAVAAALGESASELTGRFALGGFAVEAGHTALTSAMFRDPLVIVPTRWSIANGSAYAPGTIVLHVEATLNCEASDLEVAMESAFAPTAYGATLRLAARGAGPFAASGTFQLIP